MNRSSFNSGSAETIYSAGLMLIMATVFSLLSFWTPLAFDDWIFMAEWRNVNGSRGLSLSTLINFWEEIRLYDNGRIANVLAPVFTLFSPWKEIFPIITGILAALIVLFLSKISFRAEGFSPRSILLSWCGALYLLPWRNSLFVTDYSLNYIWGAAVTVFFIILVLKYEKEGWSGGKFAFVLFVAFIAGGWHEGFAVSTLGGFFLYTLVTKERHTIQWWFTGIFYALSTAAFYFCPGMIARTGNEIGQLTSGNGLVRSVADLLPVVLLCLCMAVMYSVGPWRRIIRQNLKDRWFVIGIGIVATGSLLSLIFKHQPRSAFWPDFVALGLLFALTRKFWDKLFRSVYGSYLTILVAVAVIVPVFTGLIWQNRLWRESEEILDKLERSDMGTVYHDVIKTEDIPFYTLRIPSNSVWVTPFHYHAMRQYTGKAFTAVVPSELGKTGWKEVAEIKEGGFQRIGNSFITGNISVSVPSETEVEITLKGGGKIRTTAMLLPYLTPEGEKMVYVYVNRLRADDIEEIRPL